MTLLVLGIVWVLIDLNIGKLRVIAELAERPTQRTVEDLRAQLASRPTNADLETHRQRTTELQLEVHRLETEVQSRPDAGEYERLREKAERLEAEVAKLAATAHPDDQDNLDRMIAEQHVWMWLESFNGRSWDVDKLTNLEDKRRAYEQWAFRDESLEAARGKFMDAARAFFVKVSEENSGRDYPRYDDDGEVTWVGEITPAEDRDGGYSEEEAVRLSLEISRPTSLVAGGN
ncbi:hypothetical protein GS482_08440 [Rhodococcus hoagii]|nr:hypothetical protein [Prescottella equi]